MVCTSFQSQESLCFCVDTWKQKGVAESCTKVCRFLFLKSGFSDLTATEICALACYFPEAENFTGRLINTGQLFDTLEREILTKGKLFFKKQQHHRIKNGFRKVGKGSKELLEL